MTHVHVHPIWQFIGALLAYSITSMILFAVLYGLFLPGGFKKNFTQPSFSGASDWENAFYHSWCVQTTSMDEITPTTRVARALHGTQMALAWLPMALLLAPFDVDIT
jgi:cytochrome b